jgi:hypothetical protein
MFFRWEVTPVAAFVPGVVKWTQEIHDALLQLGQTFAPRIEAWMKANARWKDNTGNLRQSLFAEVDDLVMGVAIFFDYGLSYGSFLEFGHAGKYAIIAPALDFWGIQVWNAVKALMS